MTTAMQLQTGPRLVDSVRQQAWLTVAGAKALAGWGAAAGDSMRRFHSWVDDTKAVPSLALSCWM